MSVILTNLPNSRERIQNRVKEGVISWNWPIIMLFSRLVLFLFFQIVFSIFLFSVGERNFWNESAAWWPVTAICANLIGLLILFLLTKREGIGIIDLYRVEKHNVGRELLIVFGLLPIAVPIIYFPNVLVGTWLYGNMEKLFGLFFRPLFIWVLVPALILFPISIALVELPTYYSYIMPRLFAVGGKNWIVILVVALFHAFQHCTLPLILDWRFLIWRFAMFIPFGIFAAVCIYKRPRLLPYMMAVHGLLDLQLIIMLLPMAK